MSHFAVIAPPFYSHVRALQALAQNLIARGHRITFIQQAEVAALLSDAAVGFHAIGLGSHPVGTLDRTLQLAAHPGGLGILRLIRDMASSTDMLCRELPAALRALAVDGVIVDQMAPAGGLVAEALQLPFVSVACALPVNREAHFPLPVMPFLWGTSSAARERFASSEKIYDWLMRSHDRVLAQHASAFGLPDRHQPHQCLSPLAQISQLPHALDFPRCALPAHFHATGPLREPATSTAAPLFSDGDQPRVFASLGTLQGGRYGLFKTLAKACRELQAELLIAHCGGLSDFQARKLLRAGAAQVTDFVDQRAALAQADLAITHGGLNTVLDAVAQSTPLLVIPLAFDQPGIAARLAYHGLGSRASRFSTSHQIARRLRRLLDDRAIKQRMARLQPQMETCGGVERAADITERALLTRQPVRAEKCYDIAV
ncbi:glycosyltransferase [Pantoea sp. RRHST58]|uniref:glycosyltransferase n=1 Tax=Pantoea sp. RRHST58 TaxID=3425183 RepID=UPI003DA046F7